MNKLDEALVLLKAMPAEKQDIAADALLDFVAHDPALRLSREQIAEAARRLADIDAPSLTREQFQARVRTLTA